MRFPRSLFAQAFVRPRSIRIGSLLLCCSLLFIVWFYEDRVDAGSDRAAGTTLSTGSGSAPLARLSPLRSGPVPEQKTANHTRNRFVKALLPIPGPFFIQTCTPPTGIVISEFRSRGPNGVNDEFVELYNNTDNNLTICTADGSSGWVTCESTRLALNDSGPTYCCPEHPV